MVENLPANAGDTGSSPGLGRSHMPRSNWARGPQLLSLRVWSLCSATREAAIMRGPRTAMKSGPHLPQLEKALAQKPRPNTAINKLINLKKKKNVEEDRERGLLECVGSSTCRMEEWGCLPLSSCLEKGLKETHKEFNRCT